MLARTHKVKWQDALVEHIIREFDGGWNVIDNDLNLQPKYSTELTNMIRKDDGSLGIRWGTKFFVDTEPELAGFIQNIEYFQDHLIVVAGISIGTDCRVLSVSADGTKTIIWSDAIAKQNTGSDWAVATDYVVNQIVKDPVSGDHQICTEAHTSGATTLADDITANPTWWEPLVVNGWTGNDFVSFASYFDHLIICNGVDKPLKVDLFATNPCQYLGDDGNGGSNANVPVCKYVSVDNEYVCMAGDIQEPDLLYISDTNSSGVWQTADETVSDAGVAVNIRITKRVDAITRNITGLGRYRDKTVVMFDSIMVPGTLGNIIDIPADPDTNPPVVAHSIHEPDFNDAILAHGCVAHNSIQFLGDDLLMADLVGVASIARTAISDSITPSRPSELIDPAIQKQLSQLTTGEISKRIFSVYNLIEKQYMLFIPKPFNRQLVTTEPEMIIADFPTNVLFINVPAHLLEVGDKIEFYPNESFNTIPISAWAEPYKVHTVVSEDLLTIQLADTIVLDPDGDIHNRSSNPDNGVNIYTDSDQVTGFILSHRKIGTNIKAWSKFSGWNWRCGCRSLLGTLFFANETKIYSYGSEQSPLYEDYIGDTPDSAGNEQRPIDWSWELPWNPFKKRMNTKRLKYLGMDTRGDSDYTISAFVDDIYKNELGYRNPALQMHVYGRDAGGFGEGTQPFGGGRRMEGERLFAWPTKFKLLKLRFEGSSTRPLRIISILLALLAGSIRR